MTLFLKHTSASISLNENCDSDVRLDMEDALNRIVPEGNKLYRHSDEGKDDMPAHVKAQLVGVSLTIPITNGQLNLGSKFILFSIRIHCIFFSLARNLLK